MYILLAVVAIVVVWVLGVFVVTIYRLATGKISKEEQERILDSAKRDRANKKEKVQSKGLFHFLSYPSPLNKWGLWH